MWFIKTVRKFCTFVKMFSRKYCEPLPNDILIYWDECTLVLPVDAHENTTTISSKLSEILYMKNRILTIFSQATRPIKRTWRRGWCRSYSVVIRRRREPVTASSGIIWSQWPRRTWHDRSWYSRYLKPMWGIQKPGLLTHWPLGDINKILEK